MATWEAADDVGPGAFRARSAGLEQGSSVTFHAVQQLVDPLLGGDLPQRCL
jgi:hypothetical protein